MCFVGHFSHAQSKVGPITITHGAEIDQDKEKIIKIAGETNGKIYALALRGKKYYIKVFSSSDMKLLHNNQVVLPESKGKDMEFDEITVINGKVNIFASRFNKKTKETMLYGFAISDEGKVSGKPVTLFNTPVTRKAEQGAFYFKSSPSEDALLVLHATLFKKEEVIQYEVKLIDENLKVVTSHIEKVPFKKRKGLEFTISDFDVNNDKDVFLVINESFRDRKAKENNEKFQVHAFKSSNNYAKEVIDIKFKDKEIINCEMMTNNKGKLQLVGFYSSVRANGKANKRLKGVYASSIDVQTSKVEQLKFNEFDYDTKVKLIGKRRAGKGKDVNPYYSTHSLIEKNDGGLILMSEFQTVFVGDPQGFGPLKLTPITLTNNEIIVTSLNPDGSVAWSNVVLKKQAASYTTLSLGLSAFVQGSALTVAAGIDVPLTTLGKGPEYLSAIPIYTEDGKLTVLFNDNEKNMGVTDIEKTKNMVRYNKALPTAFVFDEKGNVTRIDQENYQEKQLVVRPRVYYRRNANEYIIYSSRKSKDKLGTLTID